jgi:hypothetical protein
MTDLTNAQWFKSSFSTGHDDGCVEVALLDSEVAVRDSKNPGGPALLYSLDEWTAFVAGVRDGQFDH